VRRRLCRAAAGWTSKSPGEIKTGLQGEPAAQFLFHLT